MLVALAESPRGRAVLPRPALQRFAIGRIIAARNLASWIGIHQDEAIGLAFITQVVAQAWFVATHESTNATLDAASSRQALRQILAATDTLTWLEQQDLTLPDWINPTGP